MMNYTFLKSPRLGKLKYAKIFPKLHYYSGKTENVHNLFKGICAKIYAKFLRKNCAICFLLFEAFQKNIKN